MKHRIGQVEGGILQELSKILRKKVRNPRLSDVTLTVAECANDFSYATVYYPLSTEDGSKEKEVAEGLEKAEGLMRRLLGQELTAYKVPELIFKRDTSVQYGSKIGKLIAQLKK